MRTRRGGPEVCVPHQAEEVVTIPTWQMSIKPMKRAQTLQLLTEHKPVLVQRFGVTQLALFGSTARDEAGVGSDIDILVAFDGPATSDRYFGVQFYLEDLLAGALSRKILRRCCQSWRTHPAKEAGRIPTLSAVRRLDWRCAAG